jgi:hypothetical protein
MVDLDLFDFDDVLALKWGEVVRGAPPSDIAIYHIESIVQARRFVGANGRRWLDQCRVYVFEEHGKQILGVECVGEITEHAARLIAEVLSAHPDPEPDYLS